MHRSSLPAIGLFLLVIIVGIYIIDTGKSPGKIQFKQIPNQLKDTRERHSAFYYDTFPELKAKTIHPAALKSKQLTIPKPFSVGVAFGKLLPGYYYHLPDDGTVSDSVDIIEWSCPACKGKPTAGWFDTADFPLTVNETTLRQIIHFADSKGRENYFLSFGTTERSFPDPLCGRWSCGYLGVAWFREQGNHFTLMAWSPCLGCFGAFQSVPGIDTISLAEDNYGCYIYNCNGGPGGPYYGSMHLFGAHNGLFQTELILPEASRGNTRTGWGSQLQSIVAATTHYDIIVNLSGDYNKYDFSDEQDMGGGDGRNVVPSQLIPFLTVGGRDSCAFSVALRYSYSKGRYQLKDWDVTVSPGGSVVYTDYNPAFVY